ncbi:unnamed protein product, partial [Scytosiphon promiscuus]
VTTLLWFRRDLRLSDHPALTAACKRGPVVPVFIRDTSVDRLGAAPKWRLGLSLEALASMLEDKGSRLILRSGKSSEVLTDLVQDTGATSILCSRSYHPEIERRDFKLKEKFDAQDIEFEMHEGHVIFDPRSVETK